ncbi:hypothetical protein OJ996_21170 [Luteolibacter sp. GHJ8]|uniref:Uncharacterized protein n=1 Tax=Luteolibacter rhizosphaerae TaxID=2989719 RepID=A0ABT3G8D5_9BACT|nr:hypothetical protein [Luteolibacter rhizosphaerae]MCW1916114.1 hypothetical protein [Luteolibacter rhizosphaerae]
MSLRTQLTEILPPLLPSNPAESIKGTELIRLARLQLNGAYSDASLRYHFSIMSCDPASPIAKVEKGQGYYRRTAPVPALTGAQELLALSHGRLDDFGSDHEAVDAALERLRKFRAVVMRYYDVNGRFPFVFRQAFAQGSPLGNLWKFPEVVLVDWETGEGPDGELTLDPTMLSLKQRMGLPPFRLHAARLRIQPSLDSFREDFFQALSASIWAQGGELIYAAPVLDEALADALRRLNAAFGVGVISFGLTPQALDDLPRPANILNAHPKETEALMERLDVHRIAAPHSRQHIDWQALDGLRRESPEIDQLIAWLSSCIENGRAEAYREEA